jgi:hypothetical protein
MEHVTLLSGLRSRYIKRNHMYPVPQDVRGPAPWMIGVAFVPYLEFCLNNSAVSATGRKPIAFNWFTPPRRPLSCALGSHKQQCVQPPAFEHRYRFLLAKQALPEAKQHMHQQMNQRSACLTFSSGDRVLLRVSEAVVQHPSLRNNFTSRWTGPCTLLEIVGRSVGSTY